MTKDLLAEFEAGLTGGTCHVSKQEHDWRFALDDGSSIAISAPWRIISQGRIAFAAVDDGHRFGLPQPMDGEAETHKLLGGKRIVKAVVDRQTADLTLYFDQDTRLDVFNNSAGYEGWESGLRLSDKSIRVIALGGGEVAIFVG